MIVCLGLNPALDITYRIDRMVRGEAQRVRSVSARAGGKATNVANVVTQLAGQAHLVCALGGPAGEIFARQLAETPIAMTGVESARPTRRTVTIVEDDGTATALNEDGEEWAAADWPLMRAAFDDLLRRSEPGVVVLTGSVPPGTPATAYADCVAAAHDRGFTTIVDCSGPHLIAAIEAGAHVVKPNRHELLATVGAEGMEGVRRLREQAPQMTVVASDGPAGLLCDGPAGRWRAGPSRPLIGNPTGAGDALVAALALGQWRGTPWPDRRTHAIGASGAAVLNPVAGQVDPSLVRELAGQARCETIG